MDFARVSVIDIRRTLPIRGGVLPVSELTDMLERSSDEIVQVEGAFRLDDELYGTFYVPLGTTGVRIALARGPLLDELRFSDQAFYGVNTGIVTRIPSGAEDVSLTGRGSPNPVRVAAAFERVYEAFAQLLSERF